MSSDEAFLAELLEALKTVELEAIVIGSTAAILHGAPILTEDVDVLVRDTPQNRTKLERLCVELHRSRPVQITPMSTTLRLIGDDEIDVDVLFDQISGGLTFALLRSRSVTIAVGEHNAVVASLEDIILSKRAANRPKDQAQLPMLEGFARARAIVDSGE